MAQKNTALWDTRFQILHQVRKQMQRCRDLPQAAEYVKEKNLNRLVVPVLGKIILFLFYFFF